MVAVIGTDGGDGTELAGDLVENLVGLTVVGVDGADQAVLRDVLEVATGRVSELNGVLAEQYGRRQPH